MQLALLKIPSKEYTQDTLAYCYKENLHRIIEKEGSSAVLSWVGLVGYGATVTGSAMHGFYGAWPTGHYAKLRDFSDSLMYVNSTVEAARGDMGGIAFFGQYPFFCLDGLILDFSERFNMTRIVRVGTKTSWISDVIGSQW